MLLHSQSFALKAFCDFKVYTPCDFGGSQFSSRNGGRLGICHDTIVGASDTQCMEKVESRLLKHFYKLQILILARDPETGNLYYTSFCTVWGGKGAGGSTKSCGCRNARLPTCAAGHSRRPQRPCDDPPRLNAPPPRGSPHQTRVGRPPAHARKISPARTS